MVDMREHPGYSGVHTREQADGGIPNETRVVKVMTQPGDAHPNGSLGTILGSIKAPPELKVMMGVSYLYFVEWDVRPRVAVGTVDLKIAPVP